MRHTILTGIFLIIFLLCYGGLLGAVEVEISGGVDYLTFHHDRSRAYIDPASTKKDFQYYPFGFGNLLIKSDIAENLAYSINFTRDNVLRDNIEGLFIAKTDYFSFQFGPFLGIPNVLEIDPKAPEIPFFGVLSNFQLVYPGVVFLDLSGSTTLGQNLDFTSNHVRDTVGARLGVWLPSAIPSVSVSYKSFKKVDPHLTVNDTLTRFQFSIDFYSKNYPMTFRLDAGYQILARKYNNNITEALTDKLEVCFAGLELRVQASNSVKIIFGAELPVPIDNKTSMEMPSYPMPKATFGFVFSRE